MKLVTRLTLVSLASTLVMTLAVLAASVVVIDKMAYRSHERLMRLELMNVLQAVRQRLGSDGTHAAIREAEAQQAALRAKDGFSTLALFVVDRTNGRIVYNPNAPTGTEISLPFVREMLQRSTGTLEYEFRGEPRFATFETLQPADWLVGLAVSRREIRAALPPFLRTIGVIQFVALALNAGVFALFGLWLMRRITATADCVHRIENGEPAARIAAGRADDEIGALQRGVNAMGERIEQRTREQQAAQAELNHSRTVLRAVLDNAPTPIALRDIDGRFVLANRRYEEVFKMREADLVGRTLAQVFEPPLAEIFLADDAQVLGSGRPAQREMVLPVDGAERCFLSQRYPLRDDRGQLTGVCVIASDITELKQAEADRQARAHAEAANRAKSDFLASMSHELRTPLNGILGYAQLLRRERGLTAWQQKALGTIQDSGEHLLALISELLDLAKIEVDKFELDPRPMPIERLLAAVSDVVRVKAEEKHLTFVYEPIDALPGWAVGDEQRLRQVLLNLLGNAVKFTDAGEVRLRVQQVPAAADAGPPRWRFEVIDTGVGMSDDELARLFRPFEQVGAGRYRTGGTGLGLAISQRLVGLMGGTIQAQSTPAGGSRFWFELPMPAADAPADAPAETPAAEAPAPPALERPLSGYAGPRRRVLVVDDTAANRASLTHLLDSLGFLVAEAVNGGEALERIEAHWPDLVLMDIRMPVMSGLLALQRMLQLPPPPGRRRPAVIMMSAHAGRAETQTALAMGADEVLQQPINQADLLDRIAHLLGLQWELRDLPPR